MRDYIYLDHAATTPVCQETVDAMLPYFTLQFGNPSTIYGIGQSAKRAVMDARETIARTLGARAEEICFTSGGSEADNWALKGVAQAYEDQGRHIITSTIEHHAVLHTCEYLEKNGFAVTYLDTDKDGRVDPERLRAAIRPDTILISVMYANNEIGTLQRMQEIGEIAHENGILFHTDAVQAYAHVDISVKECHIDLLSASGHKLGGPKGVGFLYVRKGVMLPSFIHGGMQERGRRAGTENVPGIVGLAAAVKKSFLEKEKTAEKTCTLRDHLIGRIEREIPGSILNGHRTERLPGNVNFCFEGVEAESLLIMLDMEGICASGGSACATGSLEASHVLLAIGRSREEARSAIRLTLSEENTAEEIDRAADTLVRLVERLRSSEAKDR